MYPHDLFFHQLKNVSDYFEISLDSNSLTKFDFKWISMLKVVKT